MDIKDYLHLYLGQQFVLKLKNGSGYSAPMHFEVDALRAFYRTDDSHIEPILILRPLSDMTEEEAIAVCKFVVVEKRQKQIDIQELTINHIWYIDGEMWHGDGVSEVYDKYIKFNELSADQLRYMLSKGFDLFGLIDAGLAIDKTKL